MSVTNIVLTGGPCAGKSTGLSRIEQELTNRGYKVYVVPETATEIITGGIKPTELNLIDFQRALLKIQKQKEFVYRSYAEKYSKEMKKNCVIIYDRGLLDAKAFMDDAEYKAMLDEENDNENEFKFSYDAIFHLVTAADGAERFYTLENNMARSQTVEESREIDKKIIRAWTGHSHLRVIDNSTDFKGKLDRLMAEIYSLLGEPIPNEIERKYLIEMPNLKELFEKYSVNKVNIIQTYLRSSGNIERRVRQRGIDGVYSFYYTEKSGTGLVRVEKEHKISESEYLNLLLEADTSLHQIVKERYCFVANNQYIELDIYPFWKKNAIVEVELVNEKQEVKLPDELKVIREVTEDYRYKNRSLAKEVVREVNEQTVDSLPTEWLYEVSKEEPEILGSGSKYYNEYITKDEAKAISLLCTLGRNHLVRSRTEIKNNKKEKTIEWYDIYNKKWEKC